MNNGNAGTAPTSNVVASMRPNRELTAACNVQLRKLIAAASGVTAALMATRDGLELASVVDSSHTLPCERVTTMTRSILGLSEAVLRAADLGDCQEVVIEAAGGFAVVRAVGDACDQLLLSVVTDRNAMLGQVLWAMRRCCEEIRPVAAAGGDEEMRESHLEMTLERH